MSGDIKLDHKMSLETTVHEKSYKLPDGLEVKIGRERFLAPEILFNPQLAGLENDGCGDMVFNCILKCDMTLRK